MLIKDFVKSHKELFEISAYCLGFSILIYLVYQSLFGALWAFLYSMYVSLTILLFASVYNLITGKEADWFTIYVVIGFYSFVIPKIYWDFEPDFAFRLAAVGPGFAFGLSVLVFILGKLNENNT